MTLYLTLYDIISHAIDELMDEEIDGAQSGDNIHIFARLANQEVQKVDDYLKYAKQISEMSNMS